MKFPTRHGTGEIQGNQRKARGCYLGSTKRINSRVEAEGTSRGAEEIWDSNVCTLAVLGKNMGNEQLPEKIRSARSRKWVLRGARYRGRPRLGQRSKDAVVEQRQPRGVDYHQGGQKRSTCQRVSGVGSYPAASAKAVDKEEGKL
ncbi:hypothetical protein LIER_19932 [Lithospermum erythrorhizon]|uniref:Uncharacterized protein n=1 Tax=Lithospermum erythrorhizon TaxID=34254 RepID=A0AAV3QQ65_LITER